MFGYGFSKNQICILKKCTCIGEGGVEGGGGGENMTIFIKFKNKVRNYEKLVCLGRFFVKTNMHTTCIEGHGMTTEVYKHLPKYLHNMTLTARLLTSIAVKSYSSGVRHHKSKQINQVLFSILPLNMILTI